MQGEAMRRFEPPPRTMDYPTFVEKFGSVYEHFPEIAMRAFGDGLSAASDTPSGLAEAMAKVAAALDRPAKLKLIRNHPDLAGRLGVAELTVASRTEQSGAGLDKCTPEEFRRFHALNGAYKEKFAFPFILAVAGKTRHDILAAFEKRIENDRETEFRTALAEIDKIARIRLEAMAAVTDK
jgi:OHCU decarboxylase